MITEMTGQILNFLQYESKYLQSIICDDLLIRTLISGNRPPFFPTSDVLYMKGSINSRDEKSYKERQ